MSKKKCFILDVIIFDNTFKIQFLIELIHFQQKLSNDNDYLFNFRLAIDNNQLNYNMETKPSQSVQHLNLKVKSQDGEQVFFKIKSSTPFKKLMDAYCQRQGLSANNVRFLFDGQRIHQTQTPKNMNMQNGDQIDVLVQQVGGCK